MFVIVICRSNYLEFAKLNGFTAAFTGTFTGTGKSGIRRHGILQLSSETLGQKEPHAAEFIITEWNVFEYSREGQVKVLYFA